MEYKFFKQENGIWYFKNPVTGKDMEMTVLKNGESFDVWFGMPYQTFINVVFGDVLGCKTMNEIFRMTGASEITHDLPLSKIKHLGGSSIEDILNWAEPCLRTRFDENTKEMLKKTYLPHRLAGHVQLEFE